MKDKALSLAKDLGVDVRIGMDEWGRKTVSVDAPPNTTWVWRGAKTLHLALTGSEPEDKFWGRLVMRMECGVRG